jgi:hypothetical protein
MQGSNLVTVGVNNEVRMVDGLAHFCQQVLSEIEYEAKSVRMTRTNTSSVGTKADKGTYKDMRVVVQQRPLSYIVIKTRLRFSVQCVVEVFLDGMQSDWSDRYNSRREIHVLRTILFGSSKQTLVQNFILQNEHRPSTVTSVPITLDRIQNVLVEVGIVRERAVAAILAHALLHAIVDALARALATKVVRHRIQPNESDQRVELADAVLQGRPA